MIASASKYPLTAGIVTCIIEKRKPLHSDKVFAQGRGTYYFISTIWELTNFVNFIIFNLVFFTHGK